MAKQLTLKDKNRTYTLEFTRATVKKLENMGLNSTSIAESPMNNLPRLFNGAFLAHHSSLSDRVKDDLFANIKDKENFVKALIEMYSEPFEALFDEPEENEGNVTWEQTW